jgi:hypothetical protein
MHLQPKSVPACYVAYIARDERFPGAGRDALKHAGRVARDVSRLQGNHLLVLDPYDDDTSKMWSREYGFRETAEVTDWGQPRLWLPIPSRASSAGA